MSSSELSMLSDELKPRRTPEPTAFQDFIPRPQVPDLSLIESPTRRPVNKLPSNSNAAVQAQHQHSPVNCASYADWQVKTGKPEPLLSNRSCLSNYIATSHSSNVNAHPRRTILNRLSDSAPPLGLSDSAPLFQPSATYWDFKKRPTSAPVVGLAHSDGHVSVKSPLRPTPSVVSEKVSQHKGDRRSQNLRVAPQFPPSSSAVSSDVAQQKVDQRYQNLGVGVGNQNVNFGTSHQVLPTSSRISGNTAQHGAVQRSQDVCNGAGPHLSTTSALAGNNNHVRGQYSSQNTPLHIRASANFVDGKMEIPVQFPQQSFTSSNHINQPNAGRESVHPHLAQFQDPRMFHMPAEYAMNNPRSNLNVGKATQLSVPHSYDSVLLSGRYCTPPLSNVNAYHCGSKCCCTHEHCAGANHCGPSPLQQLPLGTGVGQSYVQSALQANIDKSGMEPFKASYDDLYKIVLAQSTQLKSLQAQVEKLLLSQEQKCVLPEALHGANLSVPKALPSPDTYTQKGRMVTEDGTQTSTFESNPENHQKMSIGVMTSFIHTVAYSGRVGLLDAINNAPGTQQPCSSRECGCQSRDDSLSSSVPSSSTSGSLSPPSDRQGCRKDKCCQDCPSGKKDVEKTEQKDLAKPCAEVKKAPEERRTTHSKKSSVPSCPSGCSCNGPGVSAAITAVRGCQAVLASRAGLAADDSLTFSGADIPTVAEQPVSPLSSIHVDIQDYRESSSDHSSPASERDSLSEVSEDSDADDKENNCGLMHLNGKRGWTFYNNVLGQVNQILQENEVGSVRKEQCHRSVQHTQNGKLVAGAGVTGSVLPSCQKGTNMSATLKRVAFKPQEDIESSHDLKELALRYLRENHPEELAPNGHTPGTSNDCGERVQDMAVYNMACGTNNMSFATFRYLERYNLLPENFNPQHIETLPPMNGLRGNATGLGLHGNNHDAIHVNPTTAAGAQSVPCRRKARQADDQYAPDLRKKSSARRRHSKPANFQVHSQSPLRSSPLKGHHKNARTSKILDITALRQQPKLL